MSNQDRIAARVFWYGAIRKRLAYSVVLLTACTEGTLFEGSERYGFFGIDSTKHTSKQLANADASSGQEDSERNEVESGDLYDPNRLPIYRFTIATDAKERLAADPREYVPAELELVDGELTERMRVGLRLKGEASFRTLEAKAAFRIKIDEYDAHQRLRGRRALTLNNMLQDSSLMAERLAYEVFRELGAPAPRANHAMVYVDEQYYGVYANIETPNEDFLDRWFEVSDRTLYEETGRDFDQPDAAASFERETNEKQAEDRQNLQRLQEACISFDLDRARTLVDWPKFLLFSAIEASVNQVDGYSYAQTIPNNYRIYDSEHGFVFIPWGLDWAFGPVATQDDGLFVDPFWVRPHHGVLMRMCLNDAHCIRDYSEVLEDLATRWEGLRLEAKLDRWAEQIQTAFEADDRREVSHEFALADREITREFIRGRAHALFEACGEATADDGT